MANRTKERRRRLNYSIKRQMQIRLLFKLLSVVLLGLALSSAIFFYMSNQEVGETYRQFHIQARNFLDFLLPGIIMAFLVGLIVAVVIALFFPHKIAGPLYRIERELKERVGEGDLRVRFTVREGDEIGDLADALNTMVAKLKTKVERLNAVADELSAIAVDKEIDRERLKETVSMLERILKEFKL